MPLPNSQVSFGRFGKSGLMEGKLSPTSLNVQLLRVPKAAIVCCPAGIKISSFYECSSCYLIYLPKIQSHLAVQTADMSGMEVCLRV